MLRIIGVQMNKVFICLFFFFFLMGSSLSAACRSWFSCWKKSETAITRSSSQVPAARGLDDVQVSTFILTVTDERPNRTQRLGFCEPAKMSQKQNPVALVSRRHAVRQSALHQQPRAETLPEYWTREINRKTSLNTSQLNPRETPGHIRRLLAFAPWRKQFFRQTWRDVSSWLDAPTTACALNPPGSRQLNPLACPGPRRRLQPAAKTARQCTTRYKCTVDLTVKCDESRSTSGHRVANVLQCRELSRTGGYRGQSCEAVTQWPTLWWEWSIVFLWLLCTVCPLIHLYVLKRSHSPATCLTLWISNPSVKLLTLIFPVSTAQLPFPLLFLFKKKSSRQVGRCFLV